jgi:tetratricopeptide (TPR) repeat protein
VSALPRPDTPPGPHRDLVDALHALHHRAGWPSLRHMAQEAGCSHTTVSNVFTSPRIPGWGVLEVIVEALGGDVSEFRSLWLAATRPDDRVAAPITLIAGRAKELAAVRRHFEVGAGRLLLLTGEAGMGKSRLAATAVALAGEGIFVGCGTCLPLSTGMPLLPITDVLASVYEVDGGRWLKEALAECPAYVARSLGRLVPAVEPLVDGPLDPDDEWARHRLFAAVEAILAALASLRPFALLLEDLHWADPTTLDLVEHLLSRQVGVSVVGTWRLEDPATHTVAVEWYARVRRLSTVRVLELGPLTLEETAQQLEMLSYQQVGPHLVERIHHRSEGQPLFTEQLAAQPDTSQPLPELLSELLDRRIEGLGQAAWAIGRALGVADRALPDRLLSDVTRLAPGELSQGLHELADRHLLRRSVQNDVQLRHPLLAEAVQRRLTAPEIVDEHRRLATVLAGASEASAAEVAEHWRGAGDPEQEIVWRIRAARAAGRRFALQQEAAQWRRALELWPVDTDNVGSPAVRRCDAYLAAMDALAFTDVSTAWTVAEEAMRALPDTRGIDAAETYRRAAEFRGNLGDQAAALHLVDKAVRIYEDMPACTGYVEALARQEYLLGALGRYDEGAATAALATEISAQLGETGLYKTRLSVQALYDALCADVNLAQSRIEAARSIEPTNPDPQAEIYVAVNHTVILLMSAAGPDEVAAAARPGLEAAAPWALDTWPLSVLRANVTMAMRRAGQVQRAAELIDPVTDGPLTYARSPEYGERAVLDVLRGRFQVALARFDALSAIPVDSLFNLIELTEDVAEADLWCGDRRLRSIDY